MYIVLNIVTMVMWALRFMAGGEAGDLMVLMWSLFLLNAIFGYWRWHMGAKETAVVGGRLDAGDPICDAV